MGIFVGYVNTIGDFINMEVFLVMLVSGPCWSAIINPREIRDVN